jgi:hypothetical protein
LCDDVAVAARCDGIVLVGGRVTLVPHDIRKQRVGPPRRNSTRNASPARVLESEPILGLSNRGGDVDVVQYQMQTCIFFGSKQRGVGPRFLQHQSPLQHFLVVRLHGMPPHAGTASS